MNIEPRSHAVVVGASISGLLAAAAVADFFERVTVLDRDALPGYPRPRAGRLAPQLLVAAQQPPGHRQQ
jgi:2-polyprenyl-6-methoxyphenol hydroxylase-like FAD-dependent oxidoreductase